MESPALASGAPTVVEWELLSGVRLSTLVGRDEPTGGGQVETWRLLAGAAMSLVMSPVGVALATNFRGVAEWHVRRSMGAALPLRRVPPWRWLPEVPYDRRLARFVLLERAIGVAFAVVGITILIVVAYSVLAGQPLRAVK
ncbi:hypothetical protein ACN27G_25915 [Plantactinospora sp. WMMB334]|uniref:hypothetical protein n=1 Tax=Plantactinospora sp. WMMB334 TaxID=3404119 RepID=UPI003B928F6A